MSVGDQDRDAALARARRELARPGAGGAAPVGPRGGGRPVSAERRGPGERVLVAVLLAMCVAVGVVLLLAAL